jgi:arylsulfatase A-like enzyme
LSTAGGPHSTRRLDLIRKGPADSLRRGLQRHPPGPTDKPARAEDAESETPYITGRAMDFIRDAGDTPWCLHLSYIKPHWPYIVPAPYHDLYGPETHLDPVRSAAEKMGPHPDYGAFMEERVSRAFSDDATRTRVLTAYMGLIKQLDDQIGRLMDFVEEQGIGPDTMIIFTSDHGDYLGDHWMGEKELFHDASARIPLIVVDPDPQADATRGLTSSALVEAIDVVPTILDFFGGAAVPHIIEGRSMRPLLRGAVDKLRDVAVSEYDYSLREVRKRLGVAVKDAKLTMLFDGRWKYIFAEGFRPMLFDLQTDPSELTDLGADPAHQGEAARLERLFFDWARQTSQRTTISDARIAAGDATLDEARAGILIGYRNEEELREVLGQADATSAPQRKTD